MNEPAFESPTPTTITLPMDAGMEGMPVEGTVSPSVSTINVALPGFQGAATLAASVSPSKSLVRPVAKA